MTHYRTTVPIAGRSVEELHQELWNMEVAGMEEQDDSISVFFADRADAEAASLLLGGSPPERMEDQNWSAEWQAQWAPLCVGNRFILSPAWVDSPIPEGRIRLEMVPGNVFGGGDHPTTQICLQFLEELVQPGTSIADIGAGTGILTIASRALGARAVSCDIDPAAAAMVDFLGSAAALRTASCDGVIANIHLGVLRDLREEILRLCRPGAWILLSGFLAEQLDELVGLFGPADGVREQDGWSAAVFRNPRGR